MTIQPNTSSELMANYTDWLYPTEEFSEAVSWTGKHNSPEIIEPCPMIMKELCPYTTTFGCSLVLGVVGTTDILSSYRLKGFYGKNKMKVGVPLNSTYDSEEFSDYTMDYFWFVINDTVADHDASFEYQVSVATEGNNNPDLYVSLMDGRYPILTDSDIKSEMFGADFISISSSLSIWRERGWDTTVGVVVVVGVKKSSADEPYIVMLTSPESYPTEITRIKIDDSIEVVDPLGGERVFSIYNWKHKNIYLTLNCMSGNTTIMYQRTGQKDYDNNIYTSIPMTEDNSLIYDNLTAGTNKQFGIVGLECYSCWYFIKVKATTLPMAIHYRLTASQVDENISGSFKEMVVDTPVQVYILSGRSEKKKFLLDSMDNFILEALIANGQVEIFVGLNPFTITGEEDYVWRTVSNGGIAQIQVRTTDRNFHLGTVYYVYIKAISAIDSIISLNLQQQRSIEFVPNNRDYTFTQSKAYFNNAILFEKHQYENS